MRVASVLAECGIPPPAATFAPLHTPATLALIRFAQARFPGVLQVACFDTQRQLESHLPGQSSVQLPERLVIAHLGNGASITAVRAGLSIEIGHVQAAKAENAVAALANVVLIYRELQKLLRRR